MIRVEIYSKEQKATFQNFRDREEFLEHLSVEWSNDYSTIVTKVSKLRKRLLKTYVDAVVNNDAIRENYTSRQIVQKQSLDYTMGKAHEHLIVLVELEAESWVIYEKNKHGKKAVTKIEGNYIRIGDKRYDILEWSQTTDKKPPCAKKEAYVRAILNTPDCIANLFDFSPEPEISSARDKEFHSDVGADCRAWGEGGDEGPGGYEYF